MKTTLTASKIKILTRSVIVAILLFAGCTEFVTVPPPQTEIVTATVFTSDESAMSALRGIYSLMTTDQSFTNGQIELLSGLSSDELTNYSSNSNQQQFALANLTALNQTVLNTIWKPAYKYINNANALLAGIEGNTSLSPATKSDLEGEALFIRAFCHFYLTNLFGDIPYITSTDYLVNQRAGRTAQAGVYQKIISDLLSAQTLLAPDYSFSNGERDQPNRFAATALLAKVYLYMGNYSSAASSASLVISQSNNFALLPDPDSVFLANSNEAIWQLQPVTPEQSTGQAKLFILTSTPASVSLSNELVNSFESNDKRFISWVSEYTDDDGTFYFSFKYKVYASDNLTEYSMVLRLAEQYLIKAEAEAQLDQLSEAIADVDVIRARAGLPLIAGSNPSISKADLLLAIEQERRIELMTESGNRWFDLKRTGRATAVLAPLKQDWTETDALYPIAQSELLVDPILTQNPGY